jgi:hypothetical protein
MIVDRCQCYRRMGKLNIVYVPIGDPVGYLRKSSLDQWSVLSFLQCDHKLSAIEVNQGARLRIAPSTRNQS